MRILSHHVCETLISGCHVMTLPNLISIFRLVIVAVIIACIISRNDQAAFWLFVVAGLSDAVDGFIARQFGLMSELGAYLDPLADKALLVSVYLSLGLVDRLPAWLVIVVISRDILIVGAVILSWGLGKPIKVRPLMVSKANTVLQIALAGVVLGEAGLGIAVAGLPFLLMVAVVLLTTISTLSYMVDWLAHMSGTQAMADGPSAIQDNRKGAGE